MYADASTVHFAADTYVVDVGTAYGGTFTLSVDGQTTAPIAWNASPLDIETAFAAISVTATLAVPVQPGPFSSPLHPPLSR